MTQVRLVRTSLFIILLIASLSAGLAQAAEPVTDIRVLVDVSGSMHKTDPNNLRRPALRLLFGLAPEDTRVGMWSFAKFTNNQLKPAFATGKWKVEARKIADTVHSRGQRTNIEDVLRRSTWDWKRPGDKWSRHMILLTDGMVDVSPDKEANSASRKRILDEILPQLVNAGVRVHTVALSEQADHELLQTLSKQTDGWYERVNSSDELQRVFLRMFEQASPGDTLPLKENKFSVDKNITDMTLLVFRNKSAKPTKIRQPDGTIFNKNQHTNNVEWYEETGYDIISIKQPATGEWSILADVDPDNRVRVITNLRLAISPLPTNVLYGEEITISAQLQEQGKPIADDTILRTVNFSAELDSTVIEKPLWVKLQPDTGKKGTYESTVSNLPEPSDYIVTVLARSKTFVRSKRHSLKLHEFPIRTFVTENEDNLEIDVELIPGLFEEGSLQMGILLPDSDGVPLPLAKLDDSHWKYTTAKHYPGEIASIVVNAALPGGKAYEHLVSVSLPGEKVFIPIQVNQTATVEEKPIEPVEREDEPEALEEKDKDIEEQASDVKVKDKTTNWVLIGSILTLVNVFVIVASIYAYKRWVKGPSEIEIDLGDEDELQTAADEPADRTENKQAAVVDEPPVFDELDETPEVAAEQPEDSNAAGDDSREDSEQEDFSKMRREETRMEPVILDDGDIPEFDIPADETSQSLDTEDTTEDEFARAVAEQLGEDNSAEARPDLDDEFAAATAAQLAEDASPDETDDSAEDEFARAVAAQLAEESEEQEQQGDIDDEFARATAEQLSSESDDNKTRTNG